MVSDKQEQKRKFQLGDCTFKLRDNSDRTAFESKYKGPFVNLVSTKNPLLHEKIDQDIVDDLISFLEQIKPKK